MHPILIAVSDRELLQGSSLVEWAKALGRAGVDAVQLREKNLADRELLQTAIDLRRAMPPAVQLHINGRPDIAVSSSADGVHFPAAGLPIAEVRRGFGSSFLIGRSTHSLAEVKAAHKEGADFVFLGPIFDSPAKRKYGRPLGLGILEESTKIGVPVYAIGGISVHRIEQVASAGATGAAGIREFQQIDHLRDLVRTARQHFKVAERSVRDTERESLEITR
jgi:thiamine-phosphate pyrophosphorylase